MSFIQALFMGLIQGLTEFLPVSSSGHLALFKNLFHVETETGMLFDVLLHVGTLIAICAVYYKDICKLFLEGLCILRDSMINAAYFVRNIFLYLKNMFSKKKFSNEELDYSEYRRIVNSSYRKFVMLILVSTIPTGIIGIAAKDVVEQASELLIIPGICLIVTAILLIISDRTKTGEKGPKDITYSNAFAIGIAQGVATLPGLSRSGTTITACLISGFNRSFAVKYSFIMSIPAILGAMLVELHDFSGVEFAGADIASYVVGMIVACVVGYICIKTMLVIVRKKKFKIFAIYCLVVGIISVCGFFYTI